jgi:GDP-mannose 6-dehydrogenase
MMKYANNAFHALKVTCANEIGVLCKAHGIDGRHVMEILCQDTRLSIAPEFAFGGSCLPKDLRALLYRAKQRDLECSPLKAILVSNQQQV